MIALYGCFKREAGFWWYCLPICDHNRSRIPFWTWIGWLLCRKVMFQQREMSWLFRKENRHAKISNYDKRFLHYIIRVHNLYPSILSVGTLLILFSTWKSM